MAVDLLYLVIYWGSLGFSLHSARIKNSDRVLPLRVDVVHDVNARHFDRVN